MVKDTKKHDIELRVIIKKLTQAIEKLDKECECKTNGIYINNTGSGWNTSLYTN